MTTEGLMRTEVLVYVCVPLWAKGASAIVESVCPHARILASLPALQAAVRENSTYRRVVLLAGLPRGDAALENLHSILSICGEVPTVVLTTDPNPAFFSESLRLGVKGYLLSQETDDEMLGCAITLVSRGLSVLGSNVTKARAPDGSPADDRVLPRKAEMLGDLTPREQDVYHLLAGGLSNREIGDQLGISLRTVQMHVTRVVQKLGARSRTAAAIQAARTGTSELS